MNCAFFNYCDSSKKGASGVKNCIYKANETYQIIATGGLVATAFTLLSEQCGYHVPALMQLAILLAAGLLSLAISTYKKLDMIDETPASQEAMEAQL